jgi:hypothetical protein
MEQLAVCSRLDATPWARNKNGSDKAALEAASKMVEWYQPTLKALPASTVEVFTEYVGLSEAEVNAHIHTVRDKAWDV